MSHSNETSPSGKWICPICHRTFIKKNQIHSCDVYSIEDQHLKKTLPATVQLYHRFISLFEQFKPCHVESMKNIIALKHNSQFCSIQIQKKALKVIFRSFSLFSSPRFINTTQQSDLRYYYLLKLESMADINADLELWLSNAYNDN